VNQDKMVANVMYQRSRTAWSKVKSRISASSTSWTTPLLRSSRTSKKDCFVYTFILIWRWQLS
jgi:hypothetical protein